MSTMMSLEDWYLAAADKPGYLRRGWAHGVTISPEDMVTLAEGDVVAFEADDGLSDVFMEARWDGQRLAMSHVS